ncbi:hypothetical protein QBC35DRAFT_31398 [Podospora australis]|uniref:Uncharacterized protein n=1 Tax=Podospora australis TaxID=1536484 RepID=A0AAN6WPJ1_9PEZI|nr:hypothetical protein QBC35DRAFT_31398 [Podospora australis]
MLATWMVIFSNSRCIDTSRVHLTDSCEQENLTRLVTSCRSSTMPSSGPHLAVPSVQYKGSHQRSTPRREPVLQEIPGKFISVHKLNSLLNEKFPSGNYDVDLDQNVYKIRAPRRICRDPFLKWKMVKNHATI